MIDWLRLSFNALWIAGLTLMLTVLSYAGWLAQLQEVGVRQRLARPAFQAGLDLGLGLVSLGLFCLGRGWLEHLLWALLTLFFLWQAWGLWWER